MDSGKTLQEEWDAHLRDTEEIMKTIESVKEFVGAVLAIPYQKEIPEFKKGIYQAPVWVGFNSQFMSISGEISGNVARIYEVTFTLNDPSKYKWSDGTTGEQHVTWKIDPQALTIYPVQKEPVPEFTGDMIRPEWKDSDGTEFEVVGGTIETSFAGTHSISLKPQSNYSWPDGGQEEREFNWKISRKPVSLPVQTGIIYYTPNVVQTPTWNNAKESLFTIVDGDVSGTDAGTYDVWFKPTGNAMWDDTGGDEMRKATWTISAAALTADVSGPDGKLSDITLEFDGSQKLPEFIGYDPNFMTATDIRTNEHGEVIESTTLTHRDVGSYAIKFVPNNNSTWTDGFTTPIIVYWSITPMSVKVPYISYNGSITNIEISYEGSPVGPDKQNYDSYWVSVEGNSGTNVTKDGYTTKFSLTEASNTVWEGGGTQPKTYSWKIIKKVLDVPTLTVSEVAYNNGTAVHPTISEYDTKFIKVKNNTDTAYNPGDNYEVIFELIDPDNTIWSNGESDEQSVPWKVTELAVAVPTVTNLSFEYDGTEKSPTISDYDTAQIKVSGNKGTTVNTSGYTLKLHLIKKGSVWADTGDDIDKEYTWYITKKKIQVPIISNYTGKEYNKEKQYVSAVGNDGMYDYSLNTEGTDPVESYERGYIKITGLSGTEAKESSEYYQVVMQLTNKNNTMWDTAEESSDDIKINWTIAKKVLQVPTVKGTYTYQENVEQQCEFNDYDPEKDTGWITVTGDKKTAAGPHTATFTLVDNVNSIWSNGATISQPVTWYINEIGIDPTSLSINNADVVYDGNLHTITTANISGFDSDIFNFGGDTTGTAAKTYTVKISLKNISINKWSDPNMASTDTVDLNWTISKRKMQIPTIKAAKKTQTYNGGNITIQKADCNFGNEKDKDFIILSGDVTKKDASDTNYTVKFNIGSDHIASCRFDDGTDTGTTAEKTDTWIITRAAISSWSIATSAASITGAQGSYVDVAVTRPGDGNINVSLNKQNIISYEVNNGTKADPSVRFTDLNSTGSVDATISVLQGTNYKSSSVSNQQNPQTCKPSYTCKVTINTKRALKDYTPAEIVAKVRDNTARDFWKAGDVIPIQLEGGYVRSGVDTSRKAWISDEIYDAVVIGFDHNVEKETPTVIHNMAFALMKQHDSDTNICFYLKNLRSYDLYGATNTFLINGSRDLDTKSCVDARKVFYDSIEEIFPTEWRNVMISTQKTGFGFTTPVFNNKIFFLTPWEAGSGQGIYANDSEYENDLQKKYDYFNASRSAPSIKKVKAILSPSDSSYQNYNVNVVSRTTVADDMYKILTLNSDYNSSYIFATKRGESERKWQQHGYDFISEWIYSVTSSTQLPFTDCGFGIIPCFTIG